VVATCFRLGKPLASGAGAGHPAGSVAELRVERMKRPPLLLVSYQLVRPQTPSTQKPIARSCSGRQGNERLAL